MKIAILLPDGVGLRNYLFSDIVEILAKRKCEILVLSNVPSNGIEEIQKLHKIQIKYYHLPKYKESWLEKLCREASSYCRAKRNQKIEKNPCISSNLKRLKGFLRGCFYYTIKLITFFIGSNLGAIKFIEKLHIWQSQKNPYSNAYKNLLKTINPDVVFCTHQRAVNAISIIEMAKILNIKTITAIYSWDNLPKGRLPIRPDIYIVWSQYMADEFHKYYPDLVKNNVFITGSPQFEFYFKENLFVSRKEFCKKWGFNEDRPIICYSGDDTLTSPYDPDYLADVAEELNKIAKDKQPQILLRKCPADLSNRFDWVVKKYPDLITIVNPLWVSDTDNLHWATAYPSVEDVALLVNICRHCNAVINVGSTMALDFAVYDKPAIFINYDQLHAENWSTKTIYQFQHFRSMPHQDGVVWLNSKDEISQKIQDVLNRPNEVATYRKQWLEKIIQHPLAQSSENIVNILTTC